MLVLVVFPPSSTRTAMAEGSAAPKAKSKFQEMVAIVELMKVTWGWFGRAGLPTWVLKVMAAEES